MELRDRCKAMYETMSRNAMLRQGSPVDELMAFVQAEASLEREACAKVLDEAAQDWRKIRDPGMANNAAAYARRIRALSVPNGHLGTEAKGSNK